MSRAYILKICLAILVVTTSSCFVLYGVSQALLGSTGILPTLFGIYSLSFGAISIFLIITTLFPAKKVNIVLAKYLSFGFMVFYIIGAMDNSRISGQETLGFIILATLLLLNWLAMKRITIAA